MGYLARDFLFRMRAQDYTFCLLIVRYMLPDKIKGKSALKAWTFLHERDKVHVCYCLGCLCIYRRLNIFIVQIMYTVVALGPVTC